MFTVLTTLNWLSVLLAFIAYFLLGPLWYLVLFPRQYRVSLGRTPDEAPNPAPLYIVGPAVCVLVITLTSAVLVYALKIASYGDAIQFAALAGIGYLVANTVNVAINPNVPRPFLYGLITGGYHLTGMLLANLILVALK